MKKIILIIITSFFGFTIINAQDLAENKSNVVLSSKPWAKVEWNKKVYKLGKVLHKKPATAVFKLKNTGGKAIIISRVKGSCGCTQIDYSDKPLLPGKSTEIKATYDAANLGSFTKTVKIYMNDDIAEHVLTLKGMVVSEK